MVKLREQNKRSEISFHKKISEQFCEDNLNEGNYYQIYKLTKSDFEKSKLILDAGCGVGVFGKILSSNGHHVVGMDISRSLIGLSKSVNRQSMLVVGDMENMPFRDDCFDACVSLFVLHHFPEISNVCVEFSRVIKNNGKMSLIDTNGSNPYLKITRKIGNMLGFWMEKVGRATINETSHSYLTYVKNLEKAGFKKIGVESNYWRKSTQRIELDKSDISSVIMLTISIVESLLFKIAWKALHQPFNGHFLIICSNAVK